MRYGEGRAEFFAVAEVSLELEANSLEARGHGSVDWGKSGA
jgi:hypothetical protein